MLRDTLKTLKSVFISVKARESKENDEIEGAACRTFLRVADSREEKGFILGRPFADRQRPPGPDVERALRVMQVITNS